MDDGVYEIYKILNFLFIRDSYLKVIYNKAIYHFLICIRIKQNDVIILAYTSFNYIESFVFYNKLNFL